MVEKVTITGRLSRVETKFSFIETSHGSAFCPLAAAIPANEHVPNFSTRYKVGDIVHVTMVPQEGKNGCNWRAIKVRPVVKLTDTDSKEGPSQETPSTSHHSKNSVFINQIVTVTNVCETLAFGVSATHGSVFIPGAAFSSQEVTRLNTYLDIGDELLVSLRSQSDVNGCKFIAISATKLRDSCKPHITGVGKIISLTETCAMVWSSICGEIKCSLLSWIGGDGGKDAEWLTDLLHIGDSVLFTAVKRSGNDEWKIVKWSARGFRIGSDRVKFADSYTQTAISASEVTMRYIGPALDTILSRDDCASLKHRREGQTVVCAVLTSVDPFTIKDDTVTNVSTYFCQNSVILDWRSSQRAACSPGFRRFGAICRGVDMAVEQRTASNPGFCRFVKGLMVISSLPSDAQPEVGDTCLFLFECSVQPPQCLRLTVIPRDLIPVMQYKLVQYREYENQMKGS